ncbi:unnamed protein product, partial [Mesorhabditis belari]|uniref:Neurotransmitter-gated ion-channel transmembrane domain-containing protein n=1 Tax=Mesorhabditis belari TaxID=2138241 RepID=A0AAF3FIM6_9BILA
MTNIGDFPFDHEICSLYFMVYSYNYWDVSMSLSIPEKKIYLIAGNGEWSISRITSQIDFYNTTSYAYAFDSGAFNIFMRREPHFYIYVIVFPCFILSFLSVIGMFCSRNRKEDQLIKLSIGLTSLMSIAVLLQIVTDSIPKSKTFPLLGVYAIVCVFIIACGCAVLITIPRSIDEPILKKYEQHSSTILHHLHRLSKPHIIWHLFFQAANLINLIIFFSYW